MEKEQDNQQVIANAPIDSPKKRLNIWIVTTVILLIIIVGLVAYALGQNQKVSQKFTVPQQSVTKVSVQPTVSEQSPTKEVTPVSTGKKVSAGITNQFFSPYSVTIPSGWVDSHAATAASDTLTLTKDQYEVTISQVAGGAGSCDFPGDTPEPMAQVFTSFVGITGTFSQFRRGTEDNMTYTICEKKNSGFVFPTSVGYITFKVPAQADQATLGEMDGMIASLTK